MSLEELIEKLDMLWFTTKDPETKVKLWKLLNDLERDDIESQS